MYDGGYTSSVKYINANPTKERRLAWHFARAHTCSEPRRSSSVLGSSPLSLLQFARLPLYLIVEECGVCLNANGRNLLLLKNPKSASFGPVQKLCKYVVLWDPVVSPQGDLEECFRVLWYCNG